MENLKMLTLLFAISFTVPALAQLSNVSRAVDNGRIVVHVQTCDALRYRSPDRTYFLEKEDRNALVGTWKVVSSTNINPKDVGCEWTWRAFSFDRPKRNTAYRVRGSNNISEAITFGVNGSNNRQVADDSFVDESKNRNLADDPFVESEIYPTIIENDVTVRNPEIIQSIQVYDIQGKMVKNIQQLNVTETILDFNEQQSGMYILHLNTASSKEVFRVTKQ